MKIYLRIGLLTILFGLAVLFFFLDPLKNPFFPQCPLHALTGYYCPGCGSQRAIHSLLHLDFSGVIGNNFLFLPAVLLVLYHFAYPVLNRKFNINLPNLFYLKYTPVIILVVIVLFGILRNLPYFPFSCLAPN